MEAIEGVTQHDEGGARVYYPKASWPLGFMCHVSERN
jgi:hypothetical protein